MLRRAGECALELFEAELREPAISDTAIVRAESVEVVRRRREEWNQDLAFGARPFVLCGLLIRQLPAGTTKYSRRNGRLFLDVVGHPEFGIPFGQDRLILLWVATVAVRQKSPVVQFESGAQILNEWGMQQNVTTTAGWPADSAEYSGARYSSARRTNGRDRRSRTAAGFVSSIRCGCGFTKKASR